ncbi:MAG: hypothetical protein RIR51_1781 [Bacteroidota bacterium]|jgi:GTP-binding protein
MIIQSAKFVKSSSDYSQCPNTPLPEFAFIGRSNVGKSSLINSICKNKSLAKTSSTPGKTQLINHFLINENWHLVDLPGYGFAKVSKELRKVFEAMIFNYLFQRENLKCLYILVDIRHEPQKIDLEFMQRMGENQVPFYIVFTKADKLSATKAQANVEAYQKELLKTWAEIPPIFITSAEKNLGREEILESIEEIIQGVI